MGPGPAFFRVYLRQVLQCRTYPSEEVLPFDRVVPIDLCMRLEERARKDRAAAPAADTGLRHRIQLAAKTLDNGDRDPMAGEQAAEPHPEAHHAPTEPTLRPLAVTYHA